MRDGGQLHSVEIQRAALWLDLQAAGVHAELAEEKFDWFAQKGARNQQPATRTVVELPVAGAPALAPKAVAEKVAAPTPVKQVVPLVAGRVWHEGEGGGVVVVLEGREVLQGRARDLLARMLAAVGIADSEVSWVGIEGVVEAAAVSAEMVKMAPKRVLVLGQNALGALLGRKLGVEGWQAAPCELPGCVGVGVTYPPALLLAQPLFKRLAWQHLLAWKLSA